jgi:hypothetical protein
MRLDTIDLLYGGILLALVVRAVALYASVAARSTRRPPISRR